VGPLGRHSLWAAAATGALVLLLAVSAALVRLLPWLLAVDVPTSVVAPFAEALLAVALETALLVALPTGFAIGAAVFAERGEARALMALGAAPARLVARAGPHALVAAALAFSVMVACDSDAQAPGRIALRLIEQGRRSCASARPPRAALVPIVGVAWLCFPGLPPRVVGTLPRLGDRAWFSAANLEASADLRSFVLDDLHLATRAQPGGTRLSLSVERARVTGLSAWGRLAKLPTVARAALVSTVAALLALLAAWLVLASGLTSRVGAGATGAFSALATVRTLHFVDAAPGGWLAYGWVPVAGAAAAAAGCVALLAVARLLVRRLATASTS